jgi:lipoyl-dependent peroxiredoxin
MTLTEKVVYTAKTHTTGGREGGASRSSDGHLDVKITPPGSGSGTNPEQLFAAGWSNCFLSAMKIVASKKKITLPTETSVDAEIDLCLTGVDFSLRARLNVYLPGIDREVAQNILEGAHHICPYSKAIHGNVDVVTNLTQASSAAS